MTAIRIVPLASTGTADLERLRLVLESTFHCSARIERPVHDISIAFDPSRGQHSARGLLSILLSQRSENPERWLGVTSVDLFAPVLTFVFGEAQLGGVAAVVSVCRLDADLRGHTDPGRLQQRLEKEAVHELGHTYGLVHCQDTLCVMRASTVAEELDTKRVGFCTACLRRLRAARGSEIAH